VEFSAESEFPAKFLVGKFLLLRCSSNFVLYCFLYYYDEFCWINQNFLFFILFIYFFFYDSCGFVWVLKFWYRGFGVFHFYVEGGM
jgi:hypothetical protein